jgi:hypothetical protein
VQNVGHEIWNGFSQPFTDVASCFRGSLGARQNAAEIV